MDVMIRPEASYAAHDRCARDAPVEKKIQNCRINTVTVILLVFPT